MISYSDSIYESEKTEYYASSSGNRRDDTEAIACLTVHVATMAHLHDHDDDIVVLDFINDSVGAHPDPKQRAPGQFLAVRRPWILRELIDLLDNSPGRRLCNPRRSFLTDGRNRISYRSIGFELLEEFVVAEWAFGFAFIPI